MLLPSLARRDDVAELTDGYGHVIVDECHHLAAAAYDHSVKRIGAQFWLGLTATPARRDGLGEIVNWQLGPVRHTMSQEDQGTLTAVWEQDAGPRRLLFVHETGFCCGDDVDLSSPGALAAVHRALAADDLRNTQIVDDVAAALDRGRNCLVLTRRVAHVKILASLLAARGLAALVLQGSYDGLLVQCAGRVIRTAPGKDVAEVHDYHDPATPIVAVSLQRRMPGYRTLGFNKT